MEQDLTESQPGLKRLVIFLAVLIVGGLIVVVTTIAVRLGEMGESAADETGAGDQVSTRPAAPFGDRIVDIEAGESLVSVTPDGGRLFLHLRGPGGDRIVVLDAAGGARLGTYRLGGGIDRP